MNLLDTGYQSTNLTHRLNIRIIYKKYIFQLGMFVSCLNPTITTGPSTTNNLTDLPSLIKRAYSTLVKMDKDLKFPDNV